jgi:hypothetical protein
MFTFFRLLCFVYVTYMRDVATLALAAVSQHAQQFTAGELEEFDSHIGSYEKEAEQILVQRLQG